MDGTSRFEQMDQFRKLAERVLSIAISEGMTTGPTGEVRLGGVLFILEDWTSDTTAYYKRQLGEIPATSKSPIFCEEKANRTRHLRAASSSAERDVDNHQYRGAIHCDLARFIASLSGLPDENADEAVMLVTAVLRGEISGVRVVEIVAESGNEIFEPLLEICQRELGHVA